MFPIFSDAVPVASRLGRDKRADKWHLDTVCAGPDRNFHVRNFHVQATLVSLDGAKPDDVGEFAVEGGLPVV